MTWPEEGIIIDVARRGEFNVARCGQKKVVQRMCGQKRAI